MLKILFPLRVIVNKFLYWTAWFNFCVNCLDGPVLCNLHPRAFTFFFQMLMSLVHYRGPPPECTIKSREALIHQEQRNLRYVRRSQWVALDIWDFSRTADVLDPGPSHPVHSMTPTAVGFLQTDQKAIEIILPTTALLRKLCNQLQSIVVHFINRVE